MKPLSFSLSSQWGNGHELRQIPVWTIATWIVLNLVSIALTQPAPQPDRNGDYFSNEAPLKREHPPPILQAGSLWQVVSLPLNCRSAAGVSQPVVRRYKRGAILEAEVGRDGSDEVLVNAQDAYRRPWMAVRGKSFEDRCYVRANNRYIRPLTGQIH